MKKNSNYVVIVSRLDIREVFVYYLVTCLYNYVGIVSRLDIRELIVYVNNYVEFY